MVKACIDCGYYHSQKFNTEPICTLVSLRSYDYVTGGYKYTTVKTCQKERESGICGHNAINFIPLMTDQKK